MLKDYLPILLQVIVSIGFVSAALISSVVLGRTGRRNATKDTPYECGMLPEAGAQPRFSVKFYLVAMLFILFDIEVVFMYPWAVVYRDMLAEHATRNMILASMISFLGILFAGYIYALKKKAFDWKN